MAGLVSPIPGAKVTQPFGPSTISLEPDGFYQRDAGGPLRFRPTRFPGGVYRVDIHNGLDLRAGVGTPVLAPVTGKVIADKIDPASGDHYAKLLVRRGTVLVFSHLSRVIAPIGTKVMVGQRFALSGASGHVIGAHLHWGVYHYVGLNPAPDPRESFSWFSYNPARCLVGGDLADRRWLRPGL